MRRMFRRTFGVVAVVFAASLSGCSDYNGAAGTSTIGMTGHDPYNAVQGRDRGRGGATSGGVSSLDPTGNAADHSPLAGYPPVLP